MILFLVMLAMCKKFDNNDAVIKALKELISLKIQSGSMRLRKSHMISLTKRKLHCMMHNQGENNE